MLYALSNTAIPTNKELKVQTKRLASTFITLGLLAVAYTLYAAEPEEIIKYRQNVMKTNGANASAASAILKGKVEYQDRLLDHARTIETFTKDIPVLFPKGSDSGDTRALDSVWQKWSKFEQSARDNHAAASEFAKAVSANDKAAIKTAFKKLSDTCKSCHKDFRKKKKKK